MNFFRGKTGWAISVTCSLVFSISISKAQDTTFLRNLIYSKASDSLKSILSKPEIFRYQLIYTRIDRDKRNRPTFTHFNYRVDKNEYFNPASMVKMPVAFLALEKMNQLSSKGIDKYNGMLTDSSYSRQTDVLKDTSAESGLPSVAHYIKKVFLVSDNEAYNRLYEFNGQQFMNERLWAMGYKDFRITRRFVTMNEDENRHTNQVRFIKNSNIIYIQPPAFNKILFDFKRQIYIGNAYYDRDEKLIDSPMNFTTHNNAPLADLQQLMQTVLFPESMPEQKRFYLNKDDYKFLYRYMSMLPHESSYPNYDTSEYFDSYTKFFMFKSGKSKIPPHIRVFNKTGWSYGFLTDVAYIVDFKNKVEFMLSGVIYVNSDGILNDNKYEYEQTGYPFFKEIGNIIYDYELERNRKHKPDLSKFRVSDY
ncbi:serine hydrolase [Flavitalea sp.]|nr:serine hydrolase [Flavitalea sp.]